jgi:hypothetical protein
MAVMPLLVMLLQSCSALNLSAVILAMLSMPLQDKPGDAVSTAWASTSVQDSPAAHN